MINTTIKDIVKCLGLLVLSIVIGCSPNPDSTSMEAVDEEVAAPTTKQTTPETDERKLIKEGRVEFETGNLTSTRKTVFEAVNKHKGYISSDQEFKSPGRKSNTVIIRVPAANFDNVLKEATQGVESFESKEINVKDVTEEYLDVQARLKTKKELEQRFIELLKEAKNVTEVLEIEKQIGQLRSEIESVEGRLKYLQDRVSFSTLTMIFYESTPNETEFGRKFENGFRNGWDNLIWFFIALINIWPFILIGLGIIVGIKVYRRNR